MCIIDNESHRIEYYDSYRKKNEDFYKPVLRFLKGKWATKHKNEPFPEYEERRMLECPLQTNGYDCGVFALCAAEYRARGANLDYKEEDMPYFRQKMALELSKGEIMPV
jgi:sentrin-specific protease 1